MNVGQIGVERLVTVAHTTSDILHRVVILIGGTGSCRCNVQFVVVHALLDLSGLVAVTCTQAPVGIDAILATDADDVRGLEIVLDFYFIGLIIVILIASVISQCHRLVSHILVVQADDTACADHSSHTAHETPRRRERVVA